jgi:hypothetical protein
MLHHEDFNLQPPINPQISERLSAKFSLLIGYPFLAYQYQHILIIDIGPETHKSRAPGHRGT